MDALNESALVEGLKVTPDGLGGDAEAVRELGDGDAIVIAHEGHDQPLALLRVHAHLLDVDIYCFKSLRVGSQPLAEPDPVWDYVAIRLEG
jgi:hypothetical protein